jgi:hypothetical protein
MQVIAEYESSIDSFEEIFPMTLHIILVSAQRDGFVWVTERSAFLGDGQGNFATIDKIRHLLGQRLAFSGWGDAFALSAISHFADYATQEAVDFSDAEATMSWLKKFGDGLPNREGGRLKRGLLVATLERSPRIYRVSFPEGALGSIVMPIYDQVHATAGDVENPANLFVRYYYPRSNKSIEELIRLGVHTVRLASTLNTFSVGDPDLWVFDKGVFQQLNPDEIQKYVIESQALDVKILDHLKSYDPKNA